jgi:hypothetical protein
MKKSTLLVALVLLALAGLLFHLRIHYFMVVDKQHPGSSVFDGSRFLATLFALVDIVLVTALFTSRRTAMYAYLLNGLSVIFGTVLMAHFSITALAGKPLTVHTILLQSTLADIAIVWVDFLVGKALYDFYMRGGAGVQPAPA